MQAQGGGDGGAGSAYRGLRSRRGSSMLGEINVTPLVDVVLVLLLIFMVTAPMMSRGIDVSLPVANQPQIPQEDRVTVSIRADGRIIVGNDVVNIAVLEDRVRGHGDEAGPGQPRVEALALGDQPVDRLVQCRFSSGRA